MKLITDSKELQQLTLELRAQGKKIAFVPTMGNLHAGHASLMDIAKPQGDVLIVSVFVNPTQFGPNEDYDKYPRTLEADKTLCENHGVDILFAPAPKTIYHDDASTLINESSCSQGLCGRSRPTHFRGVCTVVNLLFNLTQANIAVFGQKDAQQVAVLNRMVRDLHIPVKIIVAPIVREADGLALSSRNQYLSQEERSAAPEIHKTLEHIAQKIKEGELNAQKIANEFISTLKANPIFNPQYIEIVNRETMQPLETIVPEKTLIAVAVYMTKSETRLIDNIEV